jgi:hypothetical protein
MSNNARHMVHKDDNNYNHGLVNIGNNRANNAKAILNTYHQVCDNPHYQSLAEQMLELKEEHQALQEDYQNLIEHFKRLTK